MGLNGVLLYFSSSIDGFVETRKGKKKKKKGLLNNNWINLYMYENLRIK